MAGNNYVVNYDINVLSADAVTSINTFVAATKKLQNATVNINKLNNQINNIRNRFAALAQKAPVIQIKTTDAERKLDRLIQKLSRVQSMAGAANLAIAGTLSAGGVATGGSGGTSSAVVRAPKKTASKPAKASTRTMRSIRYNALGQTLIDTGGVGAFDLLKGMGIAYGITGLGTLASNAIKDATEYNNIIKTAENILKSHDYGPNFDGRFKGMERTVRKVGVETKFTAPQVADAARFLAMAGFNIDDINKSIRPISDIALVGDTDLGETADVVTNIMTGYGIAPERVREAADIMTMTFTKTNSTLMEIAEAYKYAGSLLSLNGTSFEEATAAIGILGDAGIKGSQAGTTMRTIALNIAKPTGPQKEMWEQMGISRYGADGKLRDLRELFQELHDKNLGLDELGKLFHKTAASGAAALAAHVDKWNEVIELNFMSDGIVGRLAEEKKNTIQGLWMQITSAFTEAGMQAFEDMEPQIRGVMKNAIGWLTSDNAVNAVKDFSKSLWEIMGAVGELTKRIYGLYKQFEPLVLTWIKLQATMSVALIPLRYIRSVADLVTYFGSLAKNIGIATGNLIKFKGADAATWARWSSITGKSAPMMAGKWGNVMTGIGGMAGMIGGGILGAKLDPDGMLGPMIGSLLGGAAGNQIMYWLPSIFNFIKGNALKMFASTLSKVLGGIVAIGATLGIVLYKHIEAGKEATNALREWEATIHSVNGIDFSELASKTDQYLQIVNNKQLTANQALAEYIKLREKELGLIDDGIEKSGELFKDKFSGLYNPLAKWFKGINNSGRIFEYAANGSDYGGLQIKPLGNGVYSFNGTKFNAYQDFRSDHDEAAGAAIVAAELYKLGTSLHEGDPTYKMRENISKILLGTKDSKDFNAGLKSVYESFAKMESEIIPGSDKWTVHDLKGKTWEEVQKSHHYVSGQIATLKSFINNENGPIRAFQNLINTPGGMQKASREALAAFLVASGIDIFDPRYGQIGSLDWYNNFGFSNGEWGEKNFVDLSGKSRTLTSEQAKNLFGSFHSMTSSAIRYLHSNNQGLFGDFLNDALWNPQETFKLKNGDTRMLDGLTWTWNEQSKMWEPPKLSPLPAKTMGEMNALLKPSALTPVASGTEDSIVDPNTGYTNHYKSSVVPKQIIVKIENLMNVESVDMSNPDNAVVINSLKEQMAQALIDVVADFDANANSSL